MSVSCCCQSAVTEQEHVLIAPAKAGDVPSRAPLLRRALTITGWLVPGALLALMPKCPVCVAAYVAAGSGLGISIATAAQLRWMLIVLCITSLAAMAIHHVVGRFQRHRFVKRRPLDQRWPPEM